MAFEKLLVTLIRREVLEILIRISEVTTFEN